MGELKAALAAANYKVYHLLTFVSTYLVEYKINF